MSMHCCHAKLIILEMILTGLGLLEVVYMAVTLEFMAYVTTIMRYMHGCQDLDSQVKQNVI
jgi:hypothetical protein